jgi:hypothetical protein
MLAIGIVGTPNQCFGLVEATILSMKASIDAATPEVRERL